MYVIDLSVEQPWTQFEDLQFELEHYRSGLSNLPHAIVANKMDLKISQKNLAFLQEKATIPVIPVSAKYRRNVEPLLLFLRKVNNDNISSDSSEK